ncbi:MAG: ATP-binding protein [Dehalococcoidia bacterium]|nr:ATP-binding protein [Dehalococcoidia bacterium]
MKRLEEILSKRGSADTSAELSEGAPLPAEDDGAVCALCGGAGFVRRPYPLDHPRFGKAEPCECALTESVDTRRARLERLSNLGALSRFTFATFSDEGRDRASHWYGRVAEAARTYAAAPAGWLVITGPSGSGKTHLAAAIANRRIERGDPAVFMVVPDLLDHLRASYDPEEGDLSFDQLFELVRNAPLLILDDIDAASGTPWAREKLFQVVNHRYNGELPTVFTTTQAPKALDDRVASRLTDDRLTQAIVLEGPHAGGYHQVGGLTRERLAEMQFRDFDLGGAGLRPEERHSLDAAFRSAMAYADAPKGWFVLQGANGCGKTHLAAAIANRALGRGIDVFFAVVPDLLDHLRASFAPGTEVAYDELFEQVRNAGLLILDDLGAQATSPWAQEKLYQIVNYRTVAGMPTIVTTDQGDEQLNKAHPRIVARILDPSAGSVVRILAPHYRLGRSMPANAGAPPRRAVGRRRE